VIVNNTLGFDYFNYTENLPQANEGYGIKVNKNKMYEQGMKPEQ
jgi:hypothetical protein